MAQFRSTADIVDSVLKRAGEVTNGNSAYDSNGDVLDFLNRVHFSIVAGGTIPLGKDVTVQIDETWPWARAKKSLILELQPEITTGSITLTQGSEAGTFSSGPTPSVAGWYLRIDGSEGLYRIASHTAGATAFELDAAWPDSSVSGGSFSVFKLDYDLVPDYIVVDSTNDKIQFQETTDTTLTGTLTQGAYTPAQLATHVGSVMDTAGASTYTVTYSSTTKLFTIASDRGGGGGIFILEGTGSQSAYSIHKTLGFDDVNSTDAASVTSTYILGGIARLIEPFRIHRGPLQEIFGCDKESFLHDYPPSEIREGVPDRFTVYEENADGSLKVRFNRYPSAKTRIEIDKVDIPRDLKDSSSSIPLIPRKHIDVLEDAATFYIMLLKNDDRANVYAQLAQGKLQAMINQHRGSLLRTGRQFGRIVPRKELLSQRRRRLFPEEPY